MATPLTPSCRFCYSYKPQGFIQPCCPPIISANLETLSSISCTPAKVNNNIYNSDQALLMTRQKCFLQGIQSTNTMSTVQSTIANSSTINGLIYSQLVSIQGQRYTPYQPYFPPVIPSSVTQLQMMTANVGNPMPPISCRTGRGSQFVTK